MAIEIVTSFRVLMQKAGAVGRAKKQYLASPTDENKRRLEEAQTAHDAYRDVCLMADRMIVENAPHD